MNAIKQNVQNQVTLHTQQKEHIYQIKRPVKAAL